MSQTRSPSTTPWGTPTPASETTTPASCTTACWTPCSTLPTLRWISWRDLSVSGKQRQVGECLLTRPGGHRAENPDAARSHLWRPGIDASRPR
uniref:Uncharacterized protein n=1 Tax=Arundo donax TaxID=35708 RepID=A0A0A9FAL3_ARUDO